MVPVTRAFSIVLLANSIYAIVGTDFFSQWDPEHFGSFFVSSFTLFDAMTFNWVEVARDLMAESGHGMCVPDTQL